MAPHFLARRALVGTALAAAALVCACGARGPLDITVVVETPDTGADVAVPLDAASDAADAPPEATADVLEASPDTSMGPDGGPLVNCGSCIANTCGTQVVACVTSSTCATALQCTATMCLTGGTPNIQCVLGCTNGDAMTQQQLLSVFGCVLGNCGSSCTSVLGGLGGGGGGGGGG